MTASVKAHPHCKLPGQISVVAWPSGLVEQLINLLMDNMPSGFIMSNEANWLPHPVRLNIVNIKEKLADFLI